MKIIVTFLIAIFCLVGCEFNDKSSEDPTTIEELPFEMSVTVSGLVGSLELTLNGEDLLHISESDISNDAQLTFISSFNTGQSYSIEAIKQPDSQYCSTRYYMDNENGVFEDANITVHFFCQTYFRGLKGASEVSAGHEHTCAIADNEVRCWGSNADGQLDVPSDINNPTMISSGYKHSCVLTDTGIVCWGGDAIPALKEPPKDLINVKELKSGANFSCAIDDAGLHCWGAGTVAKAEKDLVAPHNLTVDLTDACVIDEGKVQCWGSTANLIPTFVPTASSITLGEYGKYCVTELNEVSCHRAGPMKYKSSDFTLLSSSLIEFGKSGGCALTGASINCWGSDYDGWQAIPNIVDSPTALSIGYYHGCAIQENELICVGKNRHGQIEIPKF
ncbi:MAG: RCC1 domain-containing protein [Oleispira sp.]